MVTGALGEVKKKEEFENVEFAPWKIAMSWTSLFAMRCTSSVTAPPYFATNISAVETIVSSGDQRESA